MTPEELEKRDGIFLNVYLRNVPGYRKTKTLLDQKKGDMGTHIESGEAVRVVHQNTHAVDFPPFFFVFLPWYLPSIFREKESAFRFHRQYACQRGIGFPRYSRAPGIKSSATFWAGTSGTSVALT